MAGSDILRIDSGKMRAVVRTLENQMSIISNCYDAIGSEALSLRGVNWEGISADVYYEGMRELCSRQGDSEKIAAGYVVDILREYILDLNNAADDLDATEGRITERMSALRTDVFGI